MFEKILREWFEAPEEGPIVGLQEALQETLQKMREEEWEEAWQEGWEKGLIQGMRQGLLRILEGRFGTLSRRARGKIGALASAEDLQAFLRRALKAGSLDELGLR